MKILVDADACPVKDIIRNIAIKKGIQMIMITDTSHIIEDDYSKVITVDKAKDSVDFYLINITQKNDIVVTQDYGVAAMALSKGAIAINQNGLIYSKHNIDRMLMERHLRQKARKAKGRISHIKKRTKDDDEAFIKALNKLLD